MKKSTQTIVQTAVLLGLSALGLQAEALTFDFKDPKGVNNVQFSLDAPLESITGTGTGISGTVTYDPAAPEKTTGTIELETSSLMVGNPVMKDHMLGTGWLDVANHPKITFEVQKVENVREQGAAVVADITGEMTIKGVSKTVTTPVSFTYLKDRLGARVNDPSKKGDLLVVRATFDINRSDFGLQPGRNTDKVAETIQLSMSIAGAAARE